jgi:hypothetical protein
MTDATLAESPQARLDRLLTLYSASQFDAAAQIAGQMDRDRQWHPIQAVVMAQLGVLRDDEAMRLRGLELLDFVRQAQPSSQSSLHEFEQILIAAHAIECYRAGDVKRVLNLLEISRRISDETARAFPLAPSADMPAPQLRLPHYVPKVPLLTLPASRGGPRPRRAVGILRKYFSGPSSREHDITARMCRGLELAGWSCPLRDPSYEGKTPVEVTAERMISIVAEIDPEVILVDNDGIALVAGAFDDFVTWLRRYRPQAKLVHINFDPWLKPQWARLRTLAAEVDLVWSHFPGLPVWNAPELAGKVCYAPFPMGIRIEEVRAQTRRPAAVFQGAVEWYNFSRVYWLTALAEVGAPIELRLTKHADDGLDPIESYLRYIEGYFSVDRLLSFSLRPGDARIITGRSFESIFAGACLIQEQTDDMDSYFIPLVHYVPFTSLQDLRDVLATLDAHPGLVQTIAQRGQEFYLERYSDERIVSCLEHMLFTSP